MYGLSPLLPEEQPSAISILMQIKRFDIIKYLLTCKDKQGNFVCTYVGKVKLYIDRLGSTGIEFPKEQDIDLIMFLLTDSYKRFVNFFHMRNLNVTLIELSKMLGQLNSTLLKRKPCLVPKKLNIVKTTRKRYFHL